MSEAAATVWLDAAWAGPGFFASPIPFDPADRGFLVGDGVFTTGLVLGHRLVWRERHVARLVAGCATLGFALDLHRVERAIDAVLAGVEHGSLRLTATRGPGPRGLAVPAAPRPTLIATAAPLRAATLFAPVALRTAPVRRNETSPLSRIKALNYADAILAVAEAAAVGADDALFLNTCGRIVCTGTANLFAVLDGRLVTPPLSDGVLDGAARRAIIDAAPRLHLAYAETSIVPDDLQRASAVFATNSLRLIAPVTTVDGLPLRRDDVVTRLADAVAERIHSEISVDPRRLGPRRRDASPSIATRPAGTSCS